MRILAVAFLMACLALAGCTQGDPGTSKGSFAPTCPAWIKGDDTATFSGPGWFHWNDTNLFSTDKIGGGGLDVRHGDPMDQVELDFHVKRDHEGNVVMHNGTPEQQFLFLQDGVLTVNFSRADNGAPLQAYDTSKGPAGPNNPPQDLLAWSADANGTLLTNFTIHVDLTPPGQPAAPTGVIAYWTFARNHYKDPDHPSWAQRDMTAYYWYRTCNADGSSAAVSSTATP